MARPLARTRGLLDGIPAPAAVAIATAWALALAAQASGRSGLLSHDWLIEGGLPIADAFAIHLGAWQVMVVAMMLPTSLPLLRMFGTAADRQEHPDRAMAALLGGYVIVWALFGIAAFGADVGLHAAIDASAPLASLEWAIGGLTLAAAGVFQFSSLKDACLKQCRHPGVFLFRYYQRGSGGAVRLGVRHGVFCVGCCWALMLIMFAVGVANLLWMAVLTAIMVHEKTRPRGRDGVPVTGVALLGAAAIVLPYSAYAAGVLG